MGKLHLMGLAQDHDLCLHDRASAGGRGQSLVGPHCQSCICVKRLHALQASESWSSVMVSSATGPGQCAAECSTLGKPAPACAS